MTHPEELDLERLRELAYAAKYRPLSDAEVRMTDELHAAEYPSRLVMQQLLRANSLVETARSLLRYLPAGPREKLELSIAHYFGEV